MPILRGVRPEPLAEILNGLTEDWGGGKQLKDDFYKIGPPRLVINGVMGPLFESYKRPEING